jgi:hypothetical protein
MHRWLICVPHATPLLSPPFSSSFPSSSAFSCAVVLMMRMPPVIGTGDATEAADAQDGSAARSAADSRTVPLQTTSASQQQRVAVAETGEAAAVYDVIQAQVISRHSCMHDTAWFIISPGLWLCSIVTSLLVCSLPLSRFPRPPCEEVT